MRILVMEQGSIAEAVPVVNKTSYIMIKLVKGFSSFTVLIAEQSPVKASMSAIPIIRS